MGVGRLVEGFDNQGRMAVFDAADVFRGVAYTSSISGPTSAEVGHSVFVRDPVRVVGWAVSDSYSGRGPVSETALLRAWYLASRLGRLAGFCPPA